MTGIIAQNVGRTSGLIKAASGGGGVWTKIKEITASADSTIDFIDGTDDVVLDSTYPIYLFKLINIHPENNDISLTFQANAAGGSGFNETITSTFFSAYQYENDLTAAVLYVAPADQAEGTSFQIIGNSAGYDNDQNTSGELWLFNPSSTTFVKHYMSKFNTTTHSDSIQHNISAGYFDTTSAIDEIQFKFVSGNIDAGTFKLYGIGDS